ncbi:MAG: hypothetical protein RSB38_07785 [Oscillospiraceae bacterium]
MDDNIDLSGAVEKLKSMMASDDGQGQLQNIISAFMGGESDVPQEPTFQSGDNTNNTNSAGGINMDNIEMMMKMQKVMSAMNNNQNNESTNFLNSLRPFLKPKRRESVDNAVKMMSLTKVLGALKDTNSDGGR